MSSVEIEDCTSRDRCVMTNAFQQGVRDLGHIYVCVCVVWVSFFYCFMIKTDISEVNVGLCFETHTNNATVENII